MSTLARTLRFDESMMWVSLADGRQLGVPLAYFPRLLRATAQQRESFVISGGGTGLHWDELDEDGLGAGHAEPDRVSFLFSPIAVLGLLVLAVFVVLGVALWRQLGDDRTASGPAPGAGSAGAASASRARSAICACAKARAAD